MSVAQRKLAVGQPMKSKKKNVMGLNENAEESLYWDQCQRNLLTFTKHF